jgi:hypothetical protein
VTWPLSPDDAILTDYYILRAPGNVATGGAFTQVGTVAAHTNEFVDSSAVLTEAYTYRIVGYGCFASGCLETPESGPGFYVPAASSGPRVIQIPD